MNNDPIGTPVTLETVPSDAIEPRTNYSRWMTEIASEIAHLKVHQLAIPGAHNSGVDKAGTFGLEEMLGANQNNSFPQQLAAGARYLDLRLVDSTYNKPNSDGQLASWTRVEVFEFKHGPVSAGRHLQHLIEAVKNFSNSNPGEIIILDFHTYDRGKHSHTSLYRLLPKFDPIKEYLIPREANNLSIADIRQQYPKGRIIFAFDHNYPEPPRPDPVPGQPAPDPEAPNPNDKWPSEVVQRKQIWGTFRHEWSSAESEQNTALFTTNTMKSPPGNNYWVLSATARNSSGAMNLNRNSPIRTEAFKDGFLNAKIVMVDFIETEESKISVVDRCIDLNRRRGSDKSKPSTPANLTVEIMDEDLVNGTKQNTLKLNWTTSTDNLGVRLYQIYRNDNIIISTSNNPYELKNQRLLNSSFKVRAVDNSDHVSDDSNTVDLIQDVTPPTIPTDLRFTYISHRAVTFDWTASLDEAGIQHYEVYLNGTLAKTETRTTCLLNDLEATEKYEITLRAKDINGFYSEYTTLTLHPRPTLINPKVNIAEYNEETGLYNGHVVWEITAEPQSELTIWYQVWINENDMRIIAHEPEVHPSFNFTARPGEEIRHHCVMWAKGPSNALAIDDSILDRDENVLGMYNHDFVFDDTAPEQITDLKINHRTPARTTISWTPSTNPNVINYAISLNEAVPVLVSASTNTYTFENYSADKDFLLEAWAINSLSFCSVPESVEIDMTPPVPPTDLEASRITNRKAVTQWKYYGDLSKLVCFQVWSNDEFIENIPTTSRSYSFTELNRGIPNTLKIRALSKIALPSEFAEYLLEPAIEPPDDLQVLNVTSTSATVKWTQYYGALKYTLQANSNTPIDVLAPSDSCEISGLTPDTAYTVTAKTVYSAGTSGPASILLNTMAAEIDPSRLPVNYHVASHGNVLVRLQWDRPVKHGWGGYVMESELGTENIAGHITSWYNKSLLEVGKVYTFKLYATYPDAEDNEQHFVTISIIGKGIEG